jgi:cytochrome c biogenesis protein CcmG/thiol:disulfide interchange protein DsbE
MPSVPKILALALPLLFMALIAVAYFRHGNVGTEPASVGKDVPSFRLRTLSGAEATEAMFAGRKAVLNVFASWCAACVFDHPAWTKLREECPDCLLVGSAWSDDPKDTAAWLKEHGNPYDAVLQDAEGSLAVGLGVTGAPETFLVEGGRIRAHVVGVVKEEDLRGVVLPFFKE